MSEGLLVIPQGSHFSKPEGQFPFWWLVLQGLLCSLFTSPHLQKACVRMALLVRTRSSLNLYPITASCQHPKRKTCVIVRYKYFPSSSLKNKDFADPEWVNVFNDCHGFFWEFCSVAIWTPRSSIAATSATCVCGKNQTKDSLLYWAYTS